MSRVRNGVAVDSIVLVFVRGVTALISIVIYKMMAMEFSVEEYGVYSTAILISSTATSISILGLSDAINFFYNKQSDKSKSQIYVYTIYGLQLIIGLLTALVIFLFRNEFARIFGTDELTQIIPLIMFIPLLTNLLNITQNLFISCKKTRIIATRNFIISVCKVVFVAISCYVLRDIKGVLVGTLIIDILSIVYMFYYCKRYIFTVNIFKGDYKLSLEIFKFSVPMAAYIITNSLIRNIDKFVISSMGGIEALAIYTVASKELPFDMLTTSFIAVLAPYITRFIAEKDYSSASDAFAKYLQLSYTVIWMLAIGAIAASKELFLILYDPKYLSGLGVFIAYIIVDMIRFANVSIIFSAKGKTVELLMYSILSLVANFALNIILYNLMGMIGPAIATVIVMLGTSCIMLLRSAKLLQCTVARLLNFKQAALILLECITFGLCASVIDKLFFTDMPIIIEFAITYSIYLIPVGLINCRKIIKLLSEINATKLI